MSSLQHTYTFSLKTKNKVEALSQSRHQSKAKDEDVVAYSTKRLVKNPNLITTNINSKSDLDLVTKIQAQD